MRAWIEDNAGRAVFVCLMVLACLLGAFYIVDSERRISDENYVQAQLWTNWADKHCEPVMHLNGATTRIGKSTYTFNGRVLGCDNGQNYTVSNDVDACGHEAKKCRYITDSIPAVPRP